MGLTGNKSNNFILQLKRFYKNHPIRILKIYQLNGTLVKQLVANEKILSITIEDLSIGSYLIVSPSNNSITGNRVRRFIKE
jgi:hypothetical protein